MHALAYQWNPSILLNLRYIKPIIEDLVQKGNINSVRLVIKQIVKFLDDTHEKLTA
jgi:hypothetical protein